LDAIEFERVSSVGRKAAGVLGVHNYDHVADGDPGVIGRTTSPVRASCPRRWNSLAPMWIRNDGEKLMQPDIFSVRTELPARYGSLLVRQAVPSNGESVY
jgi:hypothetical protein